MSSYYNKTRKIRKYKLDEINTGSKVQSDYLPAFWDKFIIQGKKYYKYMIENFHTMISDISIPHLDIRPGTYNLIDEHDLIQMQFGQEIEKQLLKWIKNEFNDARLFKEDWWKPFRNTEHLSCMSLGYKKMFIFSPNDKSVDQINKYFFQLSLERVCEEDCITCNGTNRDIHFNLLLYGWTSNNSNLIYPDEKYIISNDEMMPKEYWEWL